MDERIDTEDDAAKYRDGGDTFPNKNCFVIMPYGAKSISLRNTTADAQSATQDTVHELNFDNIYKQLIKPTVEHTLGMKCQRSDEETRSGHVHQDMLSCIVNWEVAIVDITTENANVFYELGVRHSFCPNTTVIIRRKGAKIPFNINNMRVIKYDDTNEETLARSRKELARTIRDSFKAKDNDSLVHALLPNVRVISSSPPILEQRELVRELTSPIASAFPRPASNPTAKYIGYITGDLMNVRSVDVWVNAENTKMQMARYHDGSVSANIRYFGAARDPSGSVTKDTIAEKLYKRKKARWRVGRGETEYGHVEPGTVLFTSSGSLEQRNRVKVIAHVAAMHGEPGQGYVPIQDSSGAVMRTLWSIEDYNRKMLRVKRLRSVVFPLFGSRSRRRSPQDLADQLHRAVAVYFEQNPDSTIEKVLFLAYTKGDKTLCESALGTLDREAYLAPLQNNGDASSIPLQTAAPTTAPAAGQAVNGQAATPHDDRAIPPETNRVDLGSGNGTPRTFRSQDQD